VTRLGLPGSKGCIRMANADIIDLFDQITPGTPVDLHE
jgi:lipoprotein-anchoring transpeptidase ErfK/SrfK